MTRPSKYLRHLLCLLGFCLSLAALFGWCRASGCQAAEGGVVMGIPIPVWGMVYFPALFLVLAVEMVIRPPFVDFLRSALVAVGAGCDTAFILALLSARIFCPVCLGIAAVMFILGAFEVTAMLKRSLSLQKGRLRFLASRVVPACAAFLIGMLLFGFTYSLPLPQFGSTAYAAEPVPTVGRGNACIRVYSDYFCPGCRRQEEEVAALCRFIQEKPEKNCRICFVDVPLHGRATQNYAAYFAACYLADQGTENILKARRVLFQLAEQGVQDPAAIEKSMKEAELKYRLEYGPIFRYFNEANRLIQEDGIVSTPTVVVARREGKRVFRGPTSKAHILEAL